MKNAFKNTMPYILASLLLCLVSLGVARADTTNTVLSGLITPSSQEATTTVDQRLSARRPKVQLSANDKATIVDKCSLAQNAANNIRTKDVKAASIRLQTYNDLVQHLTFLVDNMSSQGNDASQLLNAQNYFVASINNYLVDAESYKTAMDDLVNMDCKTDPTGFQATLNEARTDRVKAGADAAMIKNNLANLQKSLASARQALITHSGKKS